MNNSKTKQRSEAREIAFRLVFEYTFSRVEKQDMIEEYTAEFSSNPSFFADDIAYIKEVYGGVIAHYDEITGIISDSSKNFSTDRVFKVDLALLILAIYEIKYMPQIPYKVSVSQALELADKYSTGKSHEFINGVLAKFSEEK